jgi:phospholipid/cholesterol/gamma-HCH transport system ATP-binding protein
MRDRPRKRSTHLDIQDLWFTRGDRVVFQGLSCTFPQGKISVVLGGSGAGKSTLFRMICCLLKPDAGEIWLDGDTELLSMPKRQAKDFRRNIGMMFQGGALLDSLPIFDNVALPLREHTAKSEDEIAEQVHRMFDSVGLEGVDHLLPGELSGGMLKRAALARALILEPKLLLCDEPFSGLDPATIRRIESLFMKVNQELGITIILTSHHIGSTIRMADWVLFIAKGKAISGRPFGLQRSTDPDLAEFLAGTLPTPPSFEALLREMDQEGPKPKEDRQ